MTYDEALLEAQAQLTAGDPMAAYLALRPLLEYPIAVEDARELTSALAVFVDIAAAIAGDEFAAKMRAAANAVDDIDALYDAAFAMYDQKLYGLAATLLARANRQRPGDARIVTELATNLEALMRYHEAREVLVESGVAGHDALAMYLYGFYSMMIGDVAAARVQVAALADATGDLVFMRDQLDGMVNRAAILAAAGVDLGDHALTAWHAVINGTLLLHESPHGYDEPMRGRYAYVSDSPALMNEGIARLKQVLTATEKRVARVVSAPDRASQILALAMSRALGVPLVAWTRGEVQNALVVAWDLDAVGDSDFLIDLKMHATEQILFVHATRWIDPPHYTPDITTILYQTITHPYLGGALTVNRETHAVEPAPPDPRDDDALATEILAATATDPSVTPIELVLTIARALRALPAPDALAIDRHQGARRRQRGGSPILSARFN